MMQQLALGVRLRPASTFRTFSAGANGAALGALRAVAAGRGGPLLWLWGSRGCGRTHLLQAACALAGESGRRAAYLPLGDAAFHPGALAGLDALDLVCLDDLGCVAGRAEWQAPLFGLYEGLKERDGRLVIAAATSPLAIDFPLADLASRLRAAEVFHIRPLTDDEQGAALIERAAVLGLDLPAETLTYLQRRLPRDFGALCDVLDRLDEAALAAMRPLTVPFVRAVLDGANDDVSGPRHPS